jgi:ABC-type transporter Mla maintaining outer membrane lipid asymmetry ATPase subunit MlaF
MAVENILECKGLSKSYGRKNALNGLELKIRREKASDMIGALGLNLKRQGKVAVKRDEGAAESLARFCQGGQSVCAR